MVSAHSKKRKERSRSPLLEREKLGKPLLRSANLSPNNHADRATTKRQRNERANYNLRRISDSGKRTSKAMIHLPTHVDAYQKSSRHKFSNEVGPTGSIISESQLESTPPMPAHLINDCLLTANDYERHGVSNTGIKDMITLDKIGEEPRTDPMQSDGNLSNAHRISEYTLCLSASSHVRDVENIMTKMETVGNVDQRDIKPRVNPKSPVLQKSACRKYPGIQRNKPLERGTPSTSYPKRTRRRRHEDGKF